MSEEHEGTGKHASPAPPPPRWRDRPRQGVLSWVAGRELLLAPLFAAVGGWFAVTNSYALLAGQPQPDGWPTWAQWLWTFAWGICAIASAVWCWLWLQRPVE